MPQVPDFRSLTSSFVVSKPEKTSPKFVFVSINNPKDIRDPRKQTTIRRQAKKMSGRKRQQRHELGFVFESGTKDPGTDSADLKPVRRPDTVVPEHSESNNNLFEDQPSNSRIGFNVSLRPLGAGRGLNPFASFPIKPTPRVVQLIDSCEHSIPR
jgi:hypothetical protein